MAVTNAAILALLLGLGTVSGATFSMDPWIVVLEPGSQKNSAVLTLRYSGPPAGAQAPGESIGEPIPVEVSVARREISIDGKVGYPAGEPLSDFVLFPSQVILYPGDVTKVQLQWAGEKIPEKEMTFGLIADQVAVDAEQKAPAKKAMASVSVLTRYEGIVVLRPPKVKAAVIVDTAYAKADSSGTLLVAILNNQGTGMQSLKKISLTVAPIDAQGKPDMSKSTLYSPEIPTQFIGNSLFAGFRRRIEAPWPEKIPKGAVKVWAQFRD
jgi:hypothetical protein